MTSRRKLPILLSIGSAITAGFFTGKYYEKNYPENQIIKSYNNHYPHQADDVPVFSIIGAIPSKDSVSNSFFSYIPKILPKNFASIQAASLINEPSTKDTLPKSISTNRISQIMKYGYPGMDNIISYSDYVLSYDKRNRVAHWVFEHLTEKSVRKNDQVDRAKCNFMEAEHIHPYFRSSNADYKKSGYDRGHLAAAGNHKISQKCVEETFYLTNMAPQVGKGFNRDSWNRLEKYVRKMTKLYQNVYCCTGPLYLPKKESNGKMYVKFEVIGAQHVAVPTHFYKVVLGESKNGSLEMECYLMENTIIDDNIPLKSFQVPLELIERSAGLIFMDNVLKGKISKINGKPNH